MSNTKYLKIFLKYKPNDYGSDLINEFNCDKNALNSLFHVVFQSNEYKLKCVFFLNDTIQIIANKNGRIVSANINDFEIKYISDRYVTNSYSERYAEYLLRHSDISYVNDLMKYRLEQSQIER